MPTMITSRCWKVIERQLPPSRPSPHGGRPRCADRDAFEGIVYILRHGIPWKSLPPGLGFPSGHTCWRRLVAWQKAGVWDRIWQAFLAELNRRGRLDFERVSVDGSSIRALKGGSTRDPIQLIEENRAASTTSPSTDRAFRSRRRSLGRTSTTRR